MILGVLAFAGELKQALDRLFPCCEVFQEQGVGEPRARDHRDCRARVRGQLAQPVQCVLVQAPGAVDDDHLDLIAVDPGGGKRERSPCAPWPAGRLRREAHAGEQPASKIGRAAADDRVHDQGSLLEGVQRLQMQRGRELVLLVDAEGDRHRQPCLARALWTIRSLSLLARRRRMSPIRVFVIPAQSRSRPWAKVRSIASSSSGVAV